MKYADAPTRALRRPRLLARRTAHHRQVRAASGGHHDAGREHQNRRGLTMRRTRRGRVRTRRQDLQHQAIDEGGGTLFPGVRRPHQRLTAATARAASSTTRPCPTRRAGSWDRFQPEPQPAVAPTSFATCLLPPRRTGLTSPSPPAKATPETTARASACARICRGRVRRPVRGRRAVVGAGRGAEQGFRARVEAAAVSAARRRRCRCCGRSPTPTAACTCSVVPCCSRAITRCRRTWTRRSPIPATWCSKSRLRK